jgi:signal transduction histidine kinase
MINKRKHQNLKDVLFIENVNHELKSPLTTIKIHTEILQKNINIDPKLNQFRENLSKINTKIDYLTSLINDYTDLVKTQLNNLPFNYAIYDFDKLITDFIKNFNQHFNSITIESSGFSEKKVYIDNNRLNQALASLIWFIKKKISDDESILIEVRSNSARVFVNIKSSSFPKNNEENLNTSELKKAKINLGIGPTLATEIIKQHKGKILISRVGDYDLINFSIPCRS